MNNRKATHVEWHGSVKVPDTLVYYLAKILFCERCKVRRATDHAHRVKRRFIGWRTELDRQEYFMAAKLCSRCHKDLDEYKGEGAHERMFLIITGLVVARPKGRVQGKYQEPHPTRLWDPQVIYNYRR